MGFKMKWERTYSGIYDFNGCWETVDIGDRQWGIFKRKYSFEPKWSLRHRPLDGSDSWSHGILFKTKKELLEYFKTKVLKESN